MSRIDVLGDPRSGLAGCEAFPSVWNGEARTRNPSDDQGVPAAPVIDHGDAFMVVVKRPASPDYGTEVDVGEKVNVPAPNARQGVTQHNVRTVLVVSLGVTIIVLAVAYFAFFSA